MEEKYNQPKAGVRGSVYTEVFISKKDAFDRKSKIKYHAQGLRRLKERLKDTLKKS